MVNTQITLYSSGTIDCYEDVPLPLTFSIADIREPDKRDSHYSKTITVPGTANNNKLFQHYFEVDAYGGFNPNVKAQCSIIVNSVPVLEGHLQLLKVNILDKNKIEYEVAVYGVYANIYARLGTAELTSLDFSGYNHTLNRANIENSWTAPIGYGYVYPLIDYGFGIGSNESISVSVNHMYPALYAKEILDKIFTYAGFSYTSNFLTSELFRRLIIPADTERFNMTDTQVEATKFRAVVGSDTDINHYSNYYNTVPFNSETFDNGNNFTNSGSSVGIGNGFYYTVPASGQYTFEANISFRLDFTVTCASGSMVHNGEWVQFQVIRERSGSPNLDLGNTQQRIQHSGTITTGTLSSTFDVKIKTDPALLRPGDKIYVVFLGIKQSVSLYSSTCANVNAGYAEVRILSGSSFYSDIYNSRFVSGQTVLMNNTLPEGIKMTDYLSSIIKMFNLFVDVDKANPNNLIIEPRDDFYSSGTTQDWTSKLDISQPFEINPMGALDAKEYYFTYEEDGDYYNKAYKEKHDEIYGDRLVRVNNEFLTERKEVKLIFAPTPLANITSNVVFSEIVDNINGTTASPRKSKPRILYWGGLKSVSGITSLWNLYDNDATPVSSVKSSYPYAGHLDDPYSPTLDLNYGIPRSLFYKGTYRTGNITYTNNNLYNKYWKKYMDEITDKDSKIVTGYFRLRLADIISLSFRDKFFVDGHLLRLNKVYDYDPTKEQTVKCEFINIKDGSSFTSTSRNVSGGGDWQFDPNIPWEYSPRDIAMSRMAPDGNYYNPKTQSVRGSYNSVAWDCGAISVVGDYNAIHSGCNAVTILNSSGCTVSGGLRNVTLLNSSGVTVNESNVIYINNRRAFEQNYTSESTLLYTSGTISSSRFATMVTSPVVAVGGRPGYVIDPISSIMWSDAGSVYGSAGTIILRGGTSTTSYLQHSSTLLTSSGQQVSKAGPLAASDVTSLTPGEDLVIYMDSPSGGGTKNLSYYIIYRYNQIL